MQRGLLQICIPAYNPDDTGGEWQLNTLCAHAQAHTLARSWCNQRQGQKMLVPLQSSALYLRSASGETLLSYLTAAIRSLPCQSLVLTVSFCLFVASHAFPANMQSRPKCLQHWSLSVLAAMPVIICLIAEGRIFSETQSKRCVSI